MIQKAEQVEVQSVHKTCQQLGVLIGSWIKKVAAKQYKVHHILTC